MKLPNGKAPPGLGGAPKTYSGLAATEYCSTKYNRETRKCQSRRFRQEWPRQRSGRLAIIPARAAEV